MKINLALLSILGWLALIVQFYIQFSSGVAPHGELIIRFFSFFTVLSNILVSICTTALLFAPDSKWGRYLGKQTTVTAIAVYILVVGIVYNTILRFLWAPQGMQRVVDELLHLIIPVIFLIFWLGYKKNELKWNSFWPWLIFPLGYIFFIFIRGTFSGFYPYPFLNVTHIGYPKALINCVFVTLVFLVVSLLLIYIGKIQAGRGTGKVLVKLDKRY